MCGLKGKQRRNATTSLVSFRRRHEDAVDVLLVFLEEHFHHDDVAGGEGLTSHFLAALECRWRSGRGRYVVGEAFAVDLCHVVGA